VESPTLDQMEAQADCPRLPHEIELFPDRPSFLPGWTWDQWADALQDYAIAILQRVQAQQKWKADHWKNCKVPVGD
jgi:hypothetical protein